MPRNYRDEFIDDEIISDYKCDGCKEVGKCSRYTKYEFDSTRYLIIGLKLFHRENNLSRKISFKVDHFNEDNMLINGILIFIKKLYTFFKVLNGVQLQLCYTLGKIFKQAIISRRQEK